ncbi:MAG TPA: hypothetical protein VGI58_13745 [Streptosporangiaceae bacterium]|jgi:hypothetical protein
MKQKLEQQLQAVAKPMLHDQEHVQLMTFARVGSVSAKRKVATAAAAAALTAGVLIVNVRPRGMYLVLTDRRILFFDGDVASGGRPGRHLMTLARDKVTVSAPKGKGFGLAIQVELVIAGHDKDLKVLFPKPSKEDGKQFTALLPAAS